MLWYKAWLETRSRFLIGLGLLMLSATGIVLYYPEVVKLMPLARTIDLGGEIGRQIREQAELSGEYRGYVWSQWFRQNMTQMWTLFAALLGSGGLLSQTSGGAVLFTLSMPVSRNRVLGVRAATGLGELLALAIVPSLLIPLLSPAVGQHYSAGDAIVHAVCLFVAGTAFFSLAFLLSTVFSDLWRPLLITCSLAVVLGLCEQIIRGLSPYSLFATMSAESYFRGSGLPWVRLFASGAVSAAMLYAATRNIARQDF
jgi:ABC-2 type transport system permease protein